MLEQLLAEADKIDTIFKTFKLSFILEIIINIIIIAVLFRLTDIFINKLNKKFKSHKDTAPAHNILAIVNKVLKVLITFILAASFLQSQGYSLTSLIAGFGITGLAVGFAAQQTIASIFGTIAILTDKVYKVGDYIKTADTEGTVEIINLRSTKIRTLDNYLITIPNNVLANNVIANISKARKRRLDLTFGVTYDTTNEKLQRAMDVLSEIIQKRDDIQKDFNIFIETLANSSINIRLLAYAKTRVYDTFVKIRSDIYFEVIQKFRQENIDFAFPSHSIYIGKK